MNNVYIVKKLISNQSTGELDFDFQKEFEFDSEIQDSLEEIREGEASYADGYPIRLDVLMGMLQKLKDQQCPASPTLPHSQQVQQHPSTSLHYQHFLPTHQQGLYHHPATT